jgi:aldehyde dehydrogenase (NAD+)
MLGKFLNAGQTCVAPDYILVHHSVKDELVKHLVTAIEKFYSKNSEADYNYGKIINQKRFDKLLSYLANGKIIYGGKYNRDTGWIAPTLMDEVVVNTPLMTEEIFGPILPILTFQTSEEAMKQVKQNENPLALYLFTSNRAKQKQWIENTPFGGGSINETAWYFANKSFPFGGVGNSGLGAYHGKYTFNTFTREKPVMKSPTWFDPAIKYPPLNGKLKLFKWFIR